MIGNHMINCTGCGACLQKCPQNCITMKLDKDGFAYPIINDEICVECGVCSNVCPIDKNIYINKEQMTYYGIINKDTDSILESASGGVFIILAKYFLNKGGYVAGCVMKEKSPTHILSNNIIDVKKMQGSKYVQSDTTKVYIQIKEKLNKGVKVLFTGTPCQVDGLYSFLGSKHDNLYTIDILCHGVPSPKYFEYCLKYYENKYKFKIEDVQFRSKQGKLSWGKNYGLTLIGGKEKKYIPAKYDVYYRDFIEANSFRESCYDCAYTSENRVGDLTIGDFQGVNKFYPEIDTHNGVSVVSVNSSKGEKMIEIMDDKVFKFETLFQNASDQNGPFKKPAMRNNYRNNIYQEVYFDGYEKKQKNMLKKNFIKNLIPNGLKESIKKIVK